MGGLGCLCSTCPRLSSEPVWSRTLQTSLAILLGMLDVNLPRRSLYSGPDDERACESQQGYRSPYEVEEALCDLIISV